MDHAEKVRRLDTQGVQLRLPATIEIGDEVDLGAIRGPGTVLHPGTRLRGSHLLILPGAELGHEAPVTVENCAVGRRVKLAGGYHEGSVYLDEVVIGSGAQVRAGCVLEEQANAAHTVGLKQTILFPFVTMGSLINFCDALIAGGTSRKDHSEVGSSFIHFNFTPFGKNGDKATASLIGDVPRGVMLRSKRIFLGGQAGLVGPLSVDYGTVLAAGFVYRRDHGPDQLVIGEPMVVQSAPFSALAYRRVRDKARKNLRYIGNLVALWHWYERVRVPLVAASDTALAELYRRAIAALELDIEERITRLDGLANNVEAALAACDDQSAPAAEVGEQRRLVEAWPATAAALRGYRTLGQQDGPAHQAFAGAVAAVDFTRGYVAGIQQGLAATAAAQGTAWLQAIVAGVAACGPF